MWCKTIIVFLLICETWAFQIPKKYEKVAAKLLDVCSEQTNTDKELLKEIRAAPEIPAPGSIEEETYKPYLHCVGVTTGMIKDGAANEPAIAKVIAGHEDVYAKPVELCKGERGATEIDSAWKMYSCFLNNIENKSYVFLW